jgi:hypothetical protein
MQEHGAHREVEQGHSGLAEGLRHVCCLVNGVSGSLQSGGRLCRQLLVPGMPLLIATAHVLIPLDVRVQALVQQLLGCTPQKVRSQEIANPTKPSVEGACCHVCYPLQTRCWVQKGICMQPPASLADLPATACPRMHEICSRSKPAPGSGRCRVVGLSELRSGSGECCAMAMYASLMTAA